MIAFASEIKQLHDLAGLSGRMNAQRVRDFLATGWRWWTRQCAGNRASDDDEIPWRILILGVWGRRFGLSL